MCFKTKVWNINNSFRTIKLSEVTSVPTSSVLVLVVVCWTVLVVMSVSRYGDMIMRHIWCYGETRGCCWYPPSVHDRPPAPPDTQHTISATMAFLSGSKKGPKEEARYRREVSRFLSKPEHCCLLQCTMAMITMAMKYTEGSRYLFRN